MPGPIDKLQEVFNRALDYSDPGDRARYLQEACEYDPELLRRVQSLLEAHETSGSFLTDDPRNEEASLLSHQGASISEGPGTVIGRYKLLEQIGEGGMGVVHMAEQLEPVRRRVAFKIIKLGMDTKQVGARFEAERQALAMMDHPNIAKILDAGATESGRPFFVMDLVRGAPITRFCQQSQLGLRERLDLFKQVCQAVQHAHQKGIIHRDLKPSNILVTLDYGQPTPKIIDFGVAKATNQRLTEKTLFTQFSVMIGTPAYMSPEQAEMTSLDVDTRTDIYSLGVLLYELLTDTTPFPEEKLRSAGYDEMRRIIREEQPERPSTRLTRRRLATSSTTSDKSEIGNQRSEIDKDLDWIVMKCLEKDQRRRYETANGLAMDVERYLTSQPVVARPPSRLYEFQKTVRRHKVGFVAVGAVGLALLLGTLVSAWQAVRATRAQAAAEEQATTAEAALRFIQEDLLGQADPFRSGSLSAPDRTLTLLQAIERASGELEARYEDPPLVEASIRQTIGRAYRRLGEYEAAQQHLQASFDLFEQEVGREDLRALSTQQELAWLLTEHSGYAEATRMTREVLRIREAKLGPEHPLTLDSLQCLGTSHMWTDRLEEAIDLFREVEQRASRAVPTNQVARLMARYELARIKYWLEGDSQEVGRLAQENLRQAREILGQSHPITLRLVTPSVRALLTEGSLWEAEQLGLEAAETFEQGFAPANIDFLLLKDTLWVLENKRGLNPHESLREIVQLSHTHHGSNNIYSIYFEERLAACLGLRREFQKSKAMLDDCLDRSLEVEWPDSPEVRRVKFYLAMILAVEGRLEESAGMRTQLIASTRNSTGGDSLVVQKQLTQLAEVFARQAKWEQAAKIFASAPTHDKSAIAPGLLASSLASDRTHLRAFAHEALARLPTTDDPADAFDLAQALLLVLGQIPSIDTPRALQVSKDVLSLQTAPIKQTALSALLAWRSEDWATARTAAATLATQADGRLASLGGFIQAVVAVQQGDSQQETQLLRTAQHRLGQVLRSGDLGEEWVKVAPALIASEAATDLIYGEDATPAIGSTTLARAREAWQPLRELLEQAGWAARRQQWKQAQIHYEEAVAHSQFSWDAALLQDPLLNYKYSSFLVLTCQTNHYISFCRDAIRPDKALYLLSGYPEGDLAELGLLDARQRLEAVPADQRSGENRHWKELTLGMAEYRARNFDEALEVLERATGAFNLNCSGTAAAFGAMAAQRLEMGEQAVRLLGEAEEAHRRLMERNADDLGPSWHDTAILQIALQEAHATVSEK